MKTPKYKIVEDITENYIIPYGADPDDMAFGRIKPFAIFEGSREGYEKALLTVNALNSYEHTN